MNPEKDGKRFDNPAGDSDIDGENHSYLEGMAELDAYVGLEKSPLENSGADKQVKQEEN